MLLGREYKLRNWALKLRTGVRLFVHAFPVKLLMQGRAVYVYCDVICVPESEINIKLLKLLVWGRWI